MAQKQIEVAIWSAGDQARADALAASLKSAGLNARAEAKNSASTDITLILGGGDSSDFGSALEQATSASPDSAVVLLQTRTGSVDEQDEQRVEHQVFEVLPASVRLEQLPNHLRTILARWKRIESLKSSATTLQHLESTMDLVYFDFRPETGTFIPSRQLCLLVGLDKPENIMAPSSFLERIHSDDRAVFAGTLFEAARTGTPFCLPIRITDAEGRPRHFRARGRAFKAADEGGSARVFGVCEDTTDHMQRIEEAEARSRIDELTGLGNRRHFDDCLTSAIEEAQGSEERMALLYIDLDRFKLINDTLGHDAGDQLLRIIAARLQDAVRAHDVVCMDNDTTSPESRVSRLGGDEFTVLLSGIHCPADAEIVASRMLIAMSEPVEIQGQLLSPSGSIGIACFPDDGETTDNLRKRADTALYAAKDAGGGFRFFKQSMEDGAIRRLSLESELRTAIEKGEIELRYQPLVSDAAGQICCAEAKIHWTSPSLGFVAADEVTRIASEAGLMQPLGRLTLGNACKDAVAWRKDCESPCRLAVNIPPAQFEQDDLFDSVAEALKLTGLAPNLLDIEISESLLLRPSPAIGDALEELKRIGIGIILDEFGKGYSALGVLMNQPLDGLKLDRRLIETVGPGGEGSQLLSNIIRMATDLSLRPIATGVSDSEQAKFLWDHDCFEMQGPLFADWLTASQLRELLVQH